MELLLSQGFFSGAVDRAYYAVFHLTQALLAFSGLEFSSHQEVISAFGREFAKTKKIDPKYHKILRRAFDSRVIADYDIEAVIDRQTAEDVIAECRVFIEDVGRYLESKMFSEG